MSLLRNITNKIATFRANNVKFYGTEDSVANPTDGYMDMDEFIADIEDTRILQQYKIFFDAGGTPISTVNTSTPVATTLTTSFTPKFGKTTIVIEAGASFLAAATELGVKTKIFYRYNGGSWTGINQAPNIGSFPGAAAKNIGGDAGNLFNVITKSMMDSPGIAGLLEVKLYFWGYTGAVNITYSPDIADAWIEMKELNI